MNSRKITILCVIALALLAVAGTKVSQLTRTRALQSTSRFLVSTQDAVNGRWSSRYITAPDLATNLGPWITNSGSGGGGGTANIYTNANQFGASTTLTLKDGVRTTNQFNQGTLTNSGSVGISGGLLVIDPSEFRGTVDTYDSFRARNSLRSDGVGTFDTNTIVSGTNIANWLRLATLPAGILETDAGGNVNTNADGTSKVVRQSTLNTASNALWSGKQDVSSYLTLLSGQYSNVLFWNGATNVRTALSNIANGTVVYLAPETFTVTPSILNSNLVAGSQFQGATLANKTNIAFIGYPGATTIDGSSAPGELWWNTNCSGLYFYGLTYRGYTNWNPALLPPATGTGAYLWAGVNNYRIEKTTWDRCRFERMADHALQDKGSEATNSQQIAATYFLSTNQITVINCSFDDIGGVRTNAGAGTLTADGSAIVCSGWSVLLNKFTSSYRGVEPYNKDDAFSQPFFNCIIRGNEFVNMAEDAITFAGSTNSHYTIVEGNNIRLERGATYHGSNIVSGFGGNYGIGINMNGGLGHVVRGNVVLGMPYVGINVGASSSRVLRSSVTQNTISGISNTAGTGFGLVVGDLSNGAVVGADGIYVGQNTIEKCATYGIYGLGVHNSTFEGNQFVDSVWPGNLGYALYLNSATSISSNNIVRNNVIRELGGGTKYGIAVVSGTVRTLLDNNNIYAAQTAPILDTATAGQVVYRNQMEGTGLVRNDQTNAFEALRILGVASNSFLYVKDGSNVVGGTFGSGLTFSSGTLTASGGAASTNNPVEAIGTALLTNGTMPAVTRAMLLRGTNLWIDGGTEGTGGGFYQQAIAGTGGGLTNGMVTNILDQQTIYLRVWVTNGATLQLPQFTAAQYLDGRIPSIPTNGWVSIYITRFGSETNVQVIGPTLAGTPGYAALWATNFAGNIVTQGVSTVLQNLHATGAVTNEDSPIVQIINGYTLTFTPGGVVSNLGASTINIGPANNVVSNVGAIKGLIWTNYVQTSSNFVFSFSTNYVELKNQTNVVFTNIVEEVTATRGNIEVHVHNTTGVTMGLAWPAYGAQHGYFFQTNINNPILTYTSLTTGKHGVASISCFGTNIFATWTEWP